MARLDERTDDEMVDGYEAPHESQCVPLIWWVCLC